MMNTILEWGIPVIRAVQTARTPMLDEFFIAMSDMGSEYFYFAALPIICTLLNRAVGIRVALAVLASVMVNSVIKALVAEPRPFEFYPGLNVVAETGFGFPSGHTQQAALFWGLAIHYYRRWWVALIGASFVGVVGISRIYLGVHFPTDVLGSLLIASILLFNYRTLVKYGEGLWQPSRRIFVFAMVFLIAVFGSLYVPAKDMISAAGLGSGLVFGLLFFQSIPPLSKSMKERFFIATITGAVLLSLFVGLKLVFPAKGAPNYAIFSFIRYFSCGVTLSALPLFLSRFTRSLAQSATAIEPKPG